MKTMIYNRLFSAVVCLIAVASVGCTQNFHELNKNPNNPYRKDMSELEAIVSIFPPMVNAALHSQQNDCQHTEQMVGQYGGHLATSAPWSGTNFANFNPPQTWIDIPWTNGFAKFYVNYLEVRKLAQGENKRYLFHIANVIRVASQYRIADIYGPIPYSQVGDGSVSAPYDNVEQAYKYMITDLNNSIDSLTTFSTANPGTASALAPYDYVYGGNLTQWIKFANSLKLRLAVRIALVDEETVAGGSTFAINAIKEVAADTHGPIMSNADNALNRSIPDNTVAGYYAATGWGDVKMNATLTTYMNAFNDPRRAKFMKSGTDTASPALPPSEGNPDGVPEKFNYTNYVGIRMGAAVGNVAQFFDFDLRPESDPKTYAIMNVADPEPVLLFCAAETHFAFAEAVARGWLTAGDGAAGRVLTDKNHYDTGISLSMGQYGVSMGEYMDESMTAVEGVYVDPREVADAEGKDPKKAPSYFDMFSAFSDWKTALDGDSDFALKVAYPQSGSLEEKIEAIITQKWIANYKLGIETWSEWRRTGYPRIFPGINDSNSENVSNPKDNITVDMARMARRLRYPDIEKTNPSYMNISSPNLLGGSDVMTTELWWAKGNQQ